MPRDERIFLEDIIDACRKIERFTFQLRPEQFLDDDKTIDSVLRNLEVIGEFLRRP